MPCGAILRPTLYSMQTSDLESDGFADVLQPAGPYRLNNVRLEIADSATVVFRARLEGPAGAAVWARAWLSNEAGTLAETASGELKASEEVVLEVKLSGEELSQYAYMRIESAPLKTEHVVGMKLT